MIHTLSPEATDAVLLQNYIGHLACCEDNTPYVVPITYYFDQPSNSIISYTAEGRKVEILRNNPKVCIEVSEVTNLSEWRSVIINGTFEELTGMDAMESIRLLSTRLTRLINEQGHPHVEFIKDMNRAAEDSPKVVYRINITDKEGRYETETDE